MGFQEVALGGEARVPGDAGAGGGGVPHKLLFLDRRGIAERELGGPAMGIESRFRGPLGWGEIGVLS